MKKCSKCSNEKDLIDFPKRGSICKVCKSEISKLYYESNREAIKLRSLNYSSLNKEKVRENGKKWHQENREDILLKQRKYREDNKENISKSKKDWYIENKDKVKNYQQENRDYLSLKKKEHYNKNRDRYNSLNRIYIKNKKENNNIFKLTCSIRTLISQSFKLQYTKKAKKTIEILGCSFGEFKMYIESKFTSEMNWDNYAIYWQLDHIVPISWSKTEEDVYRLNHYTNFQPMYWRDNIIKSNRFSD